MSLICEWLRSLPSCKLWFRVRAETGPAGTRVACEFDTFIAGAPSLSESSLLRLPGLFRVDPCTAVGDSFLELYYDFKFSLVDGFAFSTGLFLRAIVY